MQPPWPYRRGICRPMHGNRQENKSCCKNCLTNEVASWSQHSSPWTIQKPQSDNCNAGLKLELRGDPVSLVSEALHAHCPPKKCRPTSCPGRCRCMSRHCLPEARLEAARTVCSRCRCWDGPRGLNCWVTTLFAFGSDLGCRQSLLVHSCIPGVPLCHLLGGQPHIMYTDAAVSSSHRKPARRC